MILSTEIPNAQQYVIAVDSSGVPRQRFVVRGGWTRIIRLLHRLSMDAAHVHPYAVMKIGSGRLGEIGILGPRQHRFTILLV